MATYPSGVKYRGLNRSGAEYGERWDDEVDGWDGSADCYFPDSVELSNELAFLASKGFNTLRFPVAWERLQHTLDGPLDTIYASQVTAFVNQATSAGWYVVLDLHNYGRYAVGAFADDGSQVLAGYEQHHLGDGTLNFSHLADLWSRFASVFTANTRVMFGIMNEPHALGFTASGWFAGMQLVIDAIRQHAPSQPILVPNQEGFDVTGWWSSDDGATDGGGAAGLRDAANNLLLDVHAYVKNPDSADSYKDRLTGVTAWARANHHHLFLSEMGVVNDADHGAGALSTLFDYMNANQDVWFGWTAWNLSPYNITPAGNYSSAGPQMPWYTRDLTPNVVNRPDGDVGPTPHSGADMGAGGPLEFAARHIEKATLVGLRGLPQRGEGGAAVFKNSYVHQLSLQPGDVEAVRSQMLRGAPSDRIEPDAPVWELLTRVEHAPLPSLSTSPSAFAAVPTKQLQAFGNALVKMRQSAVAGASGPPAPHVASGAVSIGSSHAEAARRLFGLHVAIIANQGFHLNISAQQPVGMLNLERLEISPAGIQRGELIATIPLAPLEETAVTHKEWSVTNREFTSIVTDSLENVSETGVTDNTELAQSTTSQIQHSNQFNITGTVSGGIPLISGSTTTGFTDQGSASQSATDSRKHAITLTQKASSRSKQEHKVTISTKTETGTSETATRLLKNPSTTDPIRIDYFSMMRKWLVRLYRYGLRLTYDVVIPEPAGTLRQSYAQLAALRRGLGAFTFAVVPSEIVPDTYAGEGKPHYRVLADLYKAQVPEYPTAPGPITPNGHIDTDGSWTFFELNFDVPPGYVIAEVFVSTQIGDRPGPNVNFGVLGSGFSRGGAPGPLILNNEKVLNVDGSRFLSNATGHQMVTFFFHYAEKAWVGLRVTLLPSTDKIEQWRHDVWYALYNAAQTQYISAQQDLQARIGALEAQLNNVDTLTLRREESDEVMKGVLRFLLGPGFEFMPIDVVNAIKATGADLEHGVGFTGNTLGLDPSQLTIIRQYEDVARFINQAIEWENVVTFLYSYFWDVPQGWEFVRQIRHPDAMRQAFLRAGSARVVLTIRKGWEEAWIRFADTFDPTAATSSPYLPIAQEIAAYDDRNYPGIPPANPAKTAVRLEDSVYTTSKSVLAPSAAPVTIDVESSKGFVVGLKVVIDAYDVATRVQEAQRVTDIPNDHQIVVEQLEHPHGSSGAFPVVQPGERGALIAEWNEYTPTAGTDIAVTSNLATVS